MHARFPQPQRRIREFGHLSWPKRAAIRLAVLVAVFALGLLVARAAAPATPGTNAAPQIEVVTFKSLFTDDQNFGKDPFFPESPRRKPDRPSRPDPRPVTKNTADWLKVQGHSVNSGKRTVIINGHTFEVGDQREVKHGNRSANVRCDQIEGQSVTLTVDGASQTLPIPK